MSTISIRSEAKTRAFRVPLSQMPPVMAPSMPFGNSAQPATAMCGSSRRRGPTHAGANPGLVAVSRLLLPHWPAARSCAFLPAAGRQGLHLSRAGDYSLHRRSRARHANPSRRDSASVSVRRARGGEVLSALGVLRIELARGGPLDCLLSHPPTDLPAKPSRAILRNRSRGINI